MNSHTYLLLPVALFIAASATEANASPYEQQLRQQCEAHLEPTKITVGVRQIPVTEDRTKSIAEITALGNNGVLPATSRSLGLTSQEVRHEWQVRTAMLGSNSSPGVCMRPQIAVTLVVTLNVVHVAREYPYGSCAYMAVREHEERHVRANNVAIWNLAREFEADMTGYYGNKIHYGDRQELKQWLADSITNNWTPRLKAMRLNNHRIHEAIDTEDEYRRVNGLCNGEVGKAAQRSRQIN